MFALRPAARRALTFSAARSFTNASKSFVLPDLPYDYGALEPVISGEIMKLHHSAHHKAYVNNLNIAVEQYKDAEAKNDIAKMISLEPAIRFNGGGHVNHSIFWTNLAPKNQGGGGNPEGDLLKAIEGQFGSVDTVKTQLSTLATGVQGSGWGWLASDKQGKLQVVWRQNQDPVVDLTPLLGIDVWEHAYYLQYKNVRADYVKAIWEVVNWKNVAERYSAAKKQ